MISGSIWRNTEDADVVQFLKLFTTLPMDEIEKACGAAGRRDQRSQEGAGDGATALLHGATPPTPQPRPRGRRSRKARSPKTFRRWKFRVAELEAGIGVLAAFVKAGPRRIERRGAAPDQGRRPARQRCRGNRRENDADAAEPHPGRRDQAVAGQEAPRPAQGRIAAFAFEPCQGRGNALPASIDGSEEHAESRTCPRCGQAGPRAWR